MAEDAVEKARKVRLVVMDVDGVLTDGKAIHLAPVMRQRRLTRRGFSERLQNWLGLLRFDGLEFNVQDGTGIKYLHRCGVRTAIVSGRDVEAVRERARVLGIEEVVQGAKVKIDAYEAVLARAGLGDDEVAYIGDDLPDIPVMRRAGLAVAVPNAAPEVIEHADLVTQRRGGEGAVREVAEFILKAQGKWQDILSRYIE